MPGNNVFAPSKLVNLQLSRQIALSISRSRNRALISRAFWRRSLFSRSLHTTSSLQEANSDAEMASCFWMLGRSMSRKCRTSVGFKNDEGPDALYVGALSKQWCFKLERTSRLAFKQYTSRLRIISMAIFDSEFGVDDSMLMKFTQRREKLAGRQYRVMVRWT